MTFSHLKMDGWKTFAFPFMANNLFSGALAVSFKEASKELFFLCNQRHQHGGGLCYISPFLKLHLRASSNLVSPFLLSATLRKDLYPEKSSLVDPSLFNFCRCEGCVTIIHFSLSLTHIYIYREMYMIYIYLYIYTYVHDILYTQIFIYIHIYKYMCTHLYIYTHICTYKVIFS